MKYGLIILSLIFVGCASNKAPIEIDENKYLTVDDYVRSLQDIDKAITGHFNRLLDQVEKNTEIINRREEECPCK